MSKDVMIDMETLGTTADAVILSIGAVKFNLETGKIDDEGFYRSVSVESNLDLGRRISESTLVWWLKQGPEAQGVYHEEKIDLGTALVELSDWIGAGDFSPWSNGADFDLPMLQHAYTQLKVETPWKFWNNRCFRTLKNLPGAKAIKVPFAGVKHNALADAHHQAVWACEIHKQLFGKTAVKGKVKA
jgi:hypothetical protein